MKKVDYTEGFEPYEINDPLEIYKWLAETLIYKHRGGKDVKRITFDEKYDGNYHITFYISNGTKVEVEIPRS